VTAFLRDVAGASLPVAIVLLILAATARAAIWAQLDHAPAQRVARRYLEPLGTWCLIAVAIHTVALSAAGDAGVLTLALALGLGAGAVLLRPKESPRVEPEAPLVAEPRAAPTPAGSLWARRR
jgi:TctA family transporter